ncbi:TPA: hypothetical protein ACJJXU_000909, partial [Enterobacter cloacae]
KNHKIRLLSFYLFYAMFKRHIIISRKLNGRTQDCFNSISPLNLLGIFLITSPYKENSESGLFPRVYAKSMKRKEAKKKPALIWIKVFILGCTIA